MKNMSKRIMNHHKRNHNGRTRMRKDDRTLHQERVYVRPCGCTQENVASRNLSIARAIMQSRPNYVWDPSQSKFVAGINPSIKRRFRGCMKHFDIKQAEQLVKTAAASA
jgi:hypothetical protein